MKKHRVLIVGVGSIGERHLRCLLQTGRCTAGICEPNETLRAEVAERYGVEKVFASVENAVDAHWDAAVVAAPAHVHVPLSQILLDAGAHLLIEKPLSLSLDGVERLRATAEASGRVVGVGYTHRANPMVRALRDLVREGGIGRVLNLRIAGGQPFPVFRPAYRDVYFRAHETGGGAIQDAITHSYSVGEWIAGPVTRVVVDADHLALDGVDVEDTVHALARHGPVLATYAVNLHQAPNEHTIEVTGDRGTARIEYHHNRWRWMKEPNGTWTEGAEHMTEGRDALYVAQDNVFLDAIEGGPPPLCTLEEGIQTLKTNLASLQSWREQRWVEVTR